MSKIDISKIKIMFVTFLVPILIYPPPPEIQRVGHLPSFPSALPVPVERDHFRDLGVDVRIILK
jgi:hypothetical protein